MVRNIFDFTTEEPDADEDTPPSEGKVIESRVNSLRAWKPRMTDYEQVAATKRAFLTLDDEEAWRAYASAFRKRALDESRESLRWRRLPPGLVIRTE